MKKTFAYIVLFIFFLFNLAYGANYYLSDDGTASSGSPPSGATGPCGGAASTKLNETNFNASYFSASDIVYACDDDGTITTKLFFASGQHDNISLKVPSGEAVSIIVSGDKAIEISADGVTVDGDDSGMPYSASPKFTLKSNSNMVVDINTGADNITLIDLDIRQTGSGPNWDGVRIAAVSGFSMQYCKVKDDGSYGGADERGRDGVQVTSATAPPTFIGNHIIDWGHDAINTNISTVGFIAYWNELEAPNRGYGRGFGVDVSSNTAYVFENWIHDMRLGNSLQQHGSGKIFFYNNIITDLYMCCDQSPATGSCIGIEDVSDWGENCDFNASAEGQAVYTDKGDGGEPAIEDVYIWHNTAKNISEGFFKSNNYAIADESGLTFGIVNNVADDLFQEEITAPGEYHYQMIIAIKNNSSGTQYEWAGTIQNNIFEDGPAASYEIFYWPDDSVANDTDFLHPTTKNDNDSTPAGNFNYCDEAGQDWTASTIDDNYEATLDLDAHGEMSVGSDLIDYGQTGLTVTGAPEINAITHGVNLGIKAGCLNYSTFSLSIENCMVNRDALPDSGAFEYVSASGASDIDGMNLH
jgi:hypothetical protein